MFFWDSEFIYALLLTAAAIYLTYRGARQAAVPVSPRLHRVGSAF